jgi:hypothetical protein
MASRTGHRAHQNTMSPGCSLEGDLHISLKQSAFMLSLAWPRPRGAVFHRSYGHPSTITVWVRLSVTCDKVIGHHWCTQFGLLQRLSFTARGRSVVSISTWVERSVDGNNDCGVPPLLNSLFYPRMALLGIKQQHLESYFDLGNGREPYPSDLGILRNILVVLLPIRRLLASCKSLRPSYP